MTVTYKVPGGGRWSLPVTVIDVAQSVESYRLKAVCMNCRWEGQIRLPRGTRKRRPGFGYDCPACECRTVEATTLVGTDSAEYDSRDSMERYQEALRKDMERQWGRV